MRKSVKFALISAAVVFIFVVAYACWFYFNPMKTASELKTDFKMSDQQLLNEFNSPDHAASTYNKKVLEISGNLKKTEVQDSANNVIFDKGGETIIVATFIPSEKENVKKLQPGAQVRLKGMYKGFIKGDELFGTPAEIKIDECTLVN